MLRVDDLDVRFRVGRGTVHAVRGVSLRVAAGECLAIVGESGSGKSVTARTLVGLAGPNATVRASRLEFVGRDLSGLSAARWRPVRGRQIGLVSQDALVSLDPLRRIVDEVAEPLLAHRVVPRERVAARVRSLLAEVGIDDPGLRARQYPFELSGGQRQRALIASAIAAGPKMIIADEPTTALDVTVQAQVLDLLAEIKSHGAAMLLVSHDLAVVARMADRIAVMRDGVIVEEGDTVEVLRAAGHPYTVRLLAAARPRPAISSIVDDRAPVVLDVRGLGKRFRGPDGQWRDAVSDVTFRLRRGEILGLVGESGSGKTTTARIALGLLEPDAGAVLLDGEPWSGVAERARRPRRWKLQVVQQDPVSAFDPRFTVARLVDEALGTRGRAPRAERRRRVVELLEQVGLGREVLDRHPRELSGGQRQRVAIARALAPGPRVLVCDEPVSALDASIRAQVLDLLADLRQRLGLAILFISHDLGVIRHLCERVVVMREGRIVEAGAVADVFDHPEHPYTKALLAAVPRLPTFREAP